MISGRLDEGSLLNSEPLTFGGSVLGTEEHFRVQFLVNDPRAVIAYEAFEAHSEVNWAFWHDEVHIVTKGQADIAYTLPPNHRKTVVRTFSVGDTYLIPSGTRARFKITSDEPYVHVGVIMPRYEYPKDQRMDSYE